MGHDAPRASRWITIAVLVALAAGLAAWFASRRAITPTAEPTSDSLAIETGDQIVEQALRQIPGYVDSTAIKSRWVDEVDGVDVSSLDDAQLEIFVRAANDRRCTCGCGYTLAACRRFDTTCPVSLGLVEALRDSVSSGAIATAQGLRERPLD